MRIFISGGAGYLGYNLVRSLEKRPEVKEIIVYDNLFRKNLNFFILGEKLNKTSFIKGDILNEFELNKYLQNIDVVYHLAAFVDAPYSYKDSFNYEQINHFGTATLVNALRNNLPKKVIFTSSGAVFGNQENGNEETTPEPQNAYGISKLNGEKYINLLTDEIEVSIFRIANVFGFNPMFRLDSIINNMIFDALLYNKIKINGNGENERPFIHIDQVSKFLCNAAFEKASKPLVNLVQHNQKINTVKDILLEEFNDLEFQYLNTNQKINSYRMHSLYTDLEQSDFKTNVIKTIGEFKRNFKL